MPYRETQAEAYDYYNIENKINKAMLTIASCPA
jgi:hypothetical protein